MSRLKQMLIPCLIFLFFGSSMLLPDKLLLSPVKKSLFSSTPESYSSSMADSVVQVVFEFSEVVSTIEDSRERAVAFHSVTFIDSIAHSLGEIVFGTTEANALQGNGWFSNETSSDVGSFQWAGDSLKRASVQLTVPENTEGFLLKINSVTDSLWMTITIEGDTAAVLRVDTCWHSGYVPYGDPQPEPLSTEEPVWTEGRSFPRFSATERVYAIKVKAPLNIGNDSWSFEWRINHSFDVMTALTLVGMQGIINRNGPRVYLDWYDPVWGQSYGTRGLWVSVIDNYLDVEYLDMDGLSAINFLYRRFSSKFNGSVVFDPEVPNTVNLAAMIAGLENRVILAPDLIGIYGIPEFTDVYDLRDLVRTHNWDVSEASQLKMYQWVYDNLWQQLDHRIIALNSPGPPNSWEAGGEGSSGLFYPLSVAEYDYSIALKLALLWLRPNEDSQAQLFGQFLDDAPSPIPVTGVFGEHEHGVTGIASSYGDWLAGISWTGVPFCSENLSVFSGIRSEIKKYEAEISKAHILETLGESPVVTLWKMGGDAIGGHINRMPGKWMPWEDCQNQKFGWTINPTLIDLAPPIWNYHVETSSEVTFVTGVSGMGYVFPLNLTSAQLDTFLDYTALYMQETGLQVVQIDDSQGAVTHDIAKRYYEKLKDTGYLGAFSTKGIESQRNLTFYYPDAPAPIAKPIYNILGDNHDEIITGLFSQKLGLVDFGSKHCMSGVETVTDENALEGDAVRIPTTILNGSTSQLVASSHLLFFPAGDYQLKFRMKVSDNQDTLRIASIIVINQLQGRTFTSAQVKPSDFSNSNQYQDFFIPLTLDSCEINVEFLIIYYNGASDLFIDYGEAIRDGGPGLPVYTPLYISDDPSNLSKTPGQFIESFENAGGLVLTPDEFMASINPEYMIDFAEPILGIGDSALNAAKAFFTDGDYLSSLMTIRDALQPRVVQKMRINPLQKTIESSQICSLDVVIEDVTNLSSFQFEVVYDPDVLQADTVLMGSFPGSTGRTVVQTGPSIDNLSGVLTFAGTTSGTASGPDSSGVLATIIFTALNPNNSPVELQNVHISNTNGQTLTVGSLLSGEITVNAPVLEAFSTQISGTSNRLYDVSAVSDNSAWITGGKGTILRTTDGGSVWSDVWSDSDTIGFYSLEALDSLTALAFGHRGSAAQGTNVGSIYYTGDGGSSWTKVYEQAGVWLNDITMFNRTEGIAVGDPLNGNWTILKTTDGGNTWTQMSNAPVQIGKESGYGTGVTWIDNVTGWFGTTTSRAYKTTDGGTNWSAIDIPVVSRVYSLAFNQSGVGLASSYYDMVKTTDNGLNWQTIASPKTGGINHIISQQDYFWALIDSSIYKSTDAGLTWELLTYSSEKLRFLSLTTNHKGTFGWAVGDNGYVIHYKDETITGINTGNETKITERYVLAQNYPNPFNSSTKIVFNLPKQEFVIIKIYNILGQEIKTLVSKDFHAGVYSVTWEGNNNYGHKVSSGIYICLMKAGDYTASKRMLLLK